MKGPRLAIESYRLPNGLKVALHRDPGVPRVVVCVAYHVGPKNERIRLGRIGKIIPNETAFSSTETKMKPSAARLIYRAAAARA